MARNRNVFKGKTDIITIIAYYKGIYTLKIPNINVLLFANCFEPFEVKTPRSIILLINISYKNNKLGDRCVH